MNITKEQVIEAAKQTTVEGALKMLFPKCFERGMEEIKPFEVDKNCMGDNCEYNLIFIAENFAPSRELIGKCFGLSANYEWILSKGKYNFQILIPTPKPCTIKKNI